MDYQKLLTPVSDDAPAGQDPDGTPAFIRLQQARQSSQGMLEGGGTDTGPNWVEVRDLAEELLEQSRDLRVAVVAVNCQLRLEGPAGLAEGIRLLEGLCRDMWPSVHPQPDEDEPDDYYLRLNALQELSPAITEAQGITAAVREAPLFTVPGFGPVRYRDVLLARGTAKAREGETVHEEAVLEGVFQEVTLDTLKGVARHVDDALDGLKSLSRLFGEQAPENGAPNFSALTGELTGLRRLLATHLADRGVDETTEGDGDASEGENGDAGRSAGPAVSGRINSREDVLRALDTICAYYNRAEPSSPVPLLLQRAKRLATMNFMDIVKDLASDGVSQVQKVAGVTDED